MRVIAVADHNRHSKRLTTIGVGEWGPPFFIAFRSLQRDPLERIIDRACPEAAVAEIRRLTNGSLRYAIDCVGKHTAKYAIESLDDSRQTYIVGLTGLPKEVPNNVQLCTVASDVVATPSVMRRIDDLF
jgi:NADPH:quinone reductase-like Zn-dependent oxidoreductase